MNLLRAEWSRLFHRRVTVVLVAAMLGVLAILVLGFGATSREPTRGELSTAQSQLAEARHYYAQDQARCAEARRAGTVRNCRMGPEPQLDTYLPYRFSFSRQIERLLYFSTLVLTLVGFILGASFIGAEWTSGGMTNLLLWRPRREAVLGAKFAVVVGAVAGITILYLGLQIGAFWLLGAAIGSVGAVSSGAAWSIALLMLRILGLTLFFAVIGAALATLGRRTAAALGVAMAYVVVLELGALIVFSLLGADNAQHGRLSTYVGALLFKRTEVFDRTGYDEHVVTWPEGAAVLTVVAVALTSVAFVVVQRRDVT